VEPRAARNEPSTTGLEPPRKFLEPPPPLPEARADSAEPAANTIEPADAGIAMPSRDADGYRLTPAARTARVCSRLNSALRKRDVIMGKFAA
jgi:hypothetical protein